jgi:NADH-quinone oxidoreductase subunit H
MGMRIALVLGVVLTFVPFFIWMERKGAAYIQDRRGPNRADILGVRIFGLLHPIADAIKLFTKEDIFPKRVHRILYTAAPMLALCIPLLMMAVIPLAAPIEVMGRRITFQVADLNVGLLYILAIGSLGVYSTILAGWASNSLYPMLGGLRASAQMISYEVAMGLALLGVIMISGTVRLGDIIAQQGTVPWEWNCIRQPLACLIFLVAMFAESNRNPFDIPEGESELVAGYHTEYSSMKFALFFMGEYSHMVVGSLFFVALFFGGWQIPFVDLNQWFYPIAVALMQIVVFLGKAFILCWLFVWVRWTLPRFRYDQLMRLGWRVLLPLALINLVVSALIITLWR